ncbi:MAG: YceI family protein [Acidobacteriaceae bacterium]|jgi:polyisoprenoid-binding protein YceI
MARKRNTAVALQLVALFGLANLAASRAMAQTETWYLDPPHSSAQFAVRHLGISTVRGAFTKVGGVVVDSPDLSKASVNVTIDASSIDTRVQRRDDDLRSDHFFDVAKYPTITFQSKRVESAGTGKLKVTGDLTMHGVTKEVVLDVDGPTPPMKDPRGTSHRGISATTTLSRADYGINFDAGMVGDQIAIQLDVELVDKAPGPPPPAAK